MTHPRSHRRGLDRRSLDITDLLPGVALSDKAVHASTRYNVRVLETLVAAEVLARKLGVRLNEDGRREKITLREVLGRFASEEEQPHWT